MSRKASLFPRVRFENAGARCMDKKQEPGDKKPCKVRNGPTNRNRNRTGAAKEIGKETRKRKTVREIVRPFWLSDC